MQCPQGCKLPSVQVVVHLDMWWADRGQALQSMVLDSGKVWDVDIIPNSVRTNNSGLSYVPSAVLVRSQ